MIQDNRDANGEEYIKRTKELMFAWGVRIVIGLTTVVGGPLAFWTLNRIVATADDIATSVHAHDTKLELIQQKAGEIKDLVADHETRIRSLESRPSGPR